jgi:hypothetical protein
VRQIIGPKASSLRGDGFKFFVYPQHLNIKRKKKEKLEAQKTQRLVGSSRPFEIEEPVFLFTTQS